MDRPKVSLVLGSGGARGYAHIGVIEVLERSGYEIVSISGASMGALIGGIYASGNLKEYTEWVLGLDVLDVASLSDLTFSRRGMMEGKRVFEKLESMVGNRTFESLPIKLTVVATDIERKKEVWFQHGDLLSAIRASIAIPSLFTPVERDGMVLVDGGVLNPLPIAPTMSDMSDMTIAVNLYADKPRPEIVLPEEPREEKYTLKKVSGELMERLYDAADGDATMFTILDKTFDTMQNALTRYHLGSYPPDILIDVSKEVCHSYDFHKASEVIEAGRMAAESALNRQTDNR